MKTRWLISSLLWIQGWNLCVHAGMGVTFVLNVLIEQYNGKFLQNRVTPQRVIAACLSPCQCEAPEIFFGTWSYLNFGFCRMIQLVLDYPDLPIHFFFKSRETIFCL
jgi:hypothetical protein